MLCRVEALSCMVYIGNGVHYSGVAEGVERVTHKSMRSASSARSPSLVTLVLPGANEERELVKVEETMAYLHSSL